MIVPTKFWKLIGIRSWLSPASRRRLGRWRACSNTLSNSFGGIRHIDGRRGSQREGLSADQDCLARRHHHLAGEQNRRRVQGNGRMIEEPYRWVEAIANRREYIEAQLAPGSPIAALGYRDGILFLTLSQTRQKIFEIYDRIALGAIGHPGDIERLRMAAIELASTEGFTRSAADVSLRRLAHYSLR